MNCREWVNRYLTLHGECRSADVKAAGMAAGYSAAMVATAVSSPGVEITRTRTAPSYSMWKLPAVERDIDPQARRAVLPLVEHGYDDLAVALLRARMATPYSGADVLAIRTALRAMIEILEADAAVAA